MRELPQVAQVFVVVSVCDVFQPLSNFLAYGLCFQWLVHFALCLSPPDGVSGLHHGPGRCSQHRGRGWAAAQTPQVVEEPQGGRGAGDVRMRSVRQNVQQAELPGQAQVRALR